MRESTPTEKALLGLAVIGFVVPNIFVVWFLAGHSFDVGEYFSLWFDSLPAAQLFADLVIASLALFVWAAIDGPRRGVGRWWVVFPATFLVGFCFALPLYLYMRERAAGMDAASA